ncbi:sodium-coupled monocarboxylate transporter 1-like, partial [Glandiceps talaboti]
VIMDNVKTFSVADFAVLASVLVISSGIGVYCAIASRKGRSSKEFLLANRRMGFLPVATSLTVSFISSVTVIGTPAEIYMNGSMFAWFSVNFLTAAIIAAHLFMPVFYNLGITSVYEYLEIRFNSKTCRIISCCTYIVLTMLYMGIGIYTPSLALSAVTGFSLWGSVLTVGLVCTFYTTIGGMKAVLWTDAFQLLVMVVGFLALLIQASINLGGWGNVMDTCNAGGRIELDNFSLDPTIRHTVWTLAVGGFFSWGSVCFTNQSQVQRYLTCRTETTAKIALYACVPGLTLLNTLAICCGLVMYATYVDCDPFTMKYVSAADQLMPFFVMDILHHLPGLPGLFISCMFSAALSTISSGLNSLAAVTGEDIVCQIWKDLPDKTYTRITVGLAFFYGLFSIFMAWLSSFMGSILQATLMVFGMLGGPQLGIFTLGLFLPWTNSKGAISGFVSGLGVALWFGIGGFLYPPYRDKLPLSTAGCPLNNATNITTLGLNYSIMTPAPITQDFLALNSSIMATRAPLPQDSYPSIAVVYSMSYHYYGATAWLVVVLVGSLVSLLTGKTNPATLNKKTLCPLIRKYYYRSMSTDSGHTVVQYTGVDTNDKVMTQEKDDTEMTEFTDMSDMHGYARLPKP